MDRVFDFSAYRISPRGEMDITFGFGPKILGSNPGEGTKWQADRSQEITGSNPVRRA